MPDPRPHKQEKTESVLVHLASEFINRKSNRDSLITVTGIRLSPDKKYATILVSILPITEIEPAMAFLSRKRQEFRNYVKSHSRIRTIPFFEFAADPDSAADASRSPLLGE